MNEVMLYSFIMIISTLISAVSQIMLKKSAQNEYSLKIREYLNTLVIVAYMLFFGTTLLSMYALRIIPLSMVPILEASGYIFIAVLSRIFLKENMTKKQLYGTFLIIAGMSIYAMKL